MPSKSSSGRLVFSTMAVRTEGEWSVIVESAVSGALFAATHRHLSAALSLATEEAAEEAQHYLGGLLEGSIYVH